MAKSLNDVLTGVKKSKVRPGSTGSDPGVDYEPKMGDEQKFIKKHDTEEHDDRVGNGSDVYSGSKVKKSLDDAKNSKLRPKGEKVYEEVIDEEAGTPSAYHIIHKPSGKVVGKAKTLKSARTARDKHDNNYGGYAHTIKPIYEEKIEAGKVCNHSKKGVVCPVHGLDDCTKVDPLKESKADLAALAAKAISTHAVKKIDAGVTSGITGHAWKKSAQSGSKLVAKKQVVVDPKSLAPSATFKGTNAHKKHVREELADIYHVNSKDSKSKFGATHSFRASDHEDAKNQMSRYLKKNYNDGPSKFTHDVEHSNSGVRKTFTEEVLDELSKNKLTNYMKASSNDHAKRYDDAEAIDASGKVIPDSHYHATAKRKNGMDLASKKIGMKEEFEHVSKPDEKISAHHEALHAHGWKMAAKLARDPEGADHIYTKKHKTSMGNVKHKITVRSPDGTWCHHSNPDYSGYRSSGVEGKGSSSLKKFASVLASHPMEEESGPDGPLNVPAMASNPTSSYPGFGSDVTVGSIV